MTVNVGYFDRMVRVAIGLILIAFALGLIPNFGPQVWGWIGIIPLATAVFGYCPLYSILGISSCPLTTPRKP
jgi:hypothetical protein